MFSTIFFSSSMVNTSGSRYLVALCRTVLIGFSRV
jgi:hypothetical protein